MLRASSLGLSITFPVVRVSRRVCPFSNQLKFSSQRMIRWSSSTVPGFTRDACVIKEESQCNRSSQSSGNGVSDEDIKIEAAKARYISRPTFLNHRARHKVAVQQLLQTSDPEKVREPENGDQDSQMSTKDTPSVGNIGDRSSDVYRALHPSPGSPKNSSAMGVHTGSDREAAPPKGEIGSIRRRCLEVLEKSFIPEEAWDAYVTLCNLVPEDRGLFDGRFIPFAHRHRLCRLLSSNKPKTHPHFLRILSVLAAIRGARGKIHLHEWNILIDHAGQGWRRPGFDDWETAFSFYNDMTTGRPPGSTLMEPNIEGDINHVVKPDTYTYTILLNIAVSTMRLSAMRQAADIIHAAKLSPNKVTHLTMVKHSTLMKQLHGVRSTLLRMQDAGLKLGLDGINACMWAYGRNGQLDIVAMIYRLLRHNIIPEDNVEEQGGISTVTRFLEDEEYITIAPDIKPDQATYVLMIQVMAYHGNLSATMHVFMEMLTYLHMNPNDGIEESKDDSTIIVDYELMNATFRAIFLGFARHGIPRVKSRKQLSSQQKLANPPNQPNWTLANLKTVFDTFTSVSPDLVPSRSTLYWILSAFEKASGSDESLLRTVWKKLDDRYGMRWVAPTNRLDRWRTRLFPDTVAETDLTQDATFVVDYDPEEDAFLL